MNVTIIGAGNMGRGIGYRMVAGGNSVKVVDHNLEDDEKLAVELRAAAKDGATVKAGSLDQIELGEVVILALGYGTGLEVAKKLGSRLAGRVVVDIANPLNTAYDGLVTTGDTSSAEELAKVVPAGVPVVKAFNTTFAGTLVSGRVNDQPLDVLIAGDDAAAKKVVADLAQAGGLVPVDAGPLNRSRQLEGLGLLGITMQFIHNTGFSTGWKFVKNS